MADGPTYYAQFDGDEVNGTRLAIGDPLPDGVDIGTIAYLLKTGRISETEPTTYSPIPLDLSKPLDLMNRDELIATLVREGIPAGTTDDDIRERIEVMRNVRDAVDDEQESAGFAPVITDDADLAPMLAGSVPALEAAIAGVTDPAQLAKLRELEEAGQKRTTALAAIDARAKAIESAG